MFRICSVGLDQPNLSIGERGPTETERVHEASLLRLVVWRYLRPDPFLRFEEVDAR